MPKQAEQYEAALDQLYITRQNIQDVYIDVLKKYGRGTPERKDFLLIKACVDVAIIDLENAALGSIAKRMEAALPDVKAATSKLKKHIAALKKIQNTAKKLTRVLASLEKVAGFLT